ncbi:hypothetical protein [Umezawaea beigongshangensis]|uniref:hypothetical protein n=1 Tax=Umezawaea beigongshangensis TaxID=2780383 RepID=UPI0018F175C5|nr:hypothetical protein [Umezawaea beigongshangensis]
METETTSRPGVGDLVLERGPDELRVWHVATPPTSRSGARVDVDVVLDGGEDLDAVDLALITEVLADVDAAVDAALEFVHESIQGHPDFFGVAGDDLAALRDASPAELPLHGPRLVFYAGDEWLVVFTEGELPVCDPYGLGVAFDRRRPVRVEDLNEAEPVG